MRFLVMKSSEPLPELSATFQIVGKFYTRDEAEKASLKVNLARGECVIVCEEWSFVTKGQKKRYKEKE